MTMDQDYDFSSSAWLRSSASPNNPLSYYLKNVRYVEDSPYLILSIELLI